MASINQKAVTFMVNCIREAEDRRILNLYSEILKKDKRFRRKNYLAWKKLHLKES